MCKIDAYYFFSVTAISTCCNMVCVVIEVNYASILPTITFFEYILWCGIENEFLLFFKAWSELRPTEACQLQQNELIQATASSLENTDLGIELLWINVSRPRRRIRLASVSFLFRSISIPPHFYGVTDTFLKWCCMCAKSAHVVIRMQLHHSIYSKHHSGVTFRNWKGHRFKTLDQTLSKNNGCCQNVGIMFKRERNHFMERRGWLPFSS